MVNAIGLAKQAIQAEQLNDWTRAVECCRFAAMHAQNRRRRARYVNRHELAYNKMEAMRKAQERAVQQAREREARRPKNNIVVEIPVRDVMIEVTDEASVKRAMDQVNRRSAGQAALASMAVLGEAMKDDNSVAYSAALQASRINPD